MEGFWERDGSGDRVDRVDKGDLVSRNSIDQRGLPHIARMNPHIVRLPQYYNRDPFRQTKAMRIATQITIRAVYCMLRKKSIHAKRRVSIRSAFSDSRKERKMNFLACLKIFRGLGTKREGERETRGERERRELRGPRLRLAR